MSSLVTNRSNFRRVVLSLLALGGSVMVCVLVWSTQALLLEDSSILIQSLESRTTEDRPVFNRIKYFPGPSEDVWMMNQSHQGLDASMDKWDRLAILVNKEARTVKYLQLSPGPLEWSKELMNESREYRVSCFICHSNGPRAIRPDLIGPSVSWSERARIWVWNMRIKSYGRLQEDPAQAQADQMLQVPMRVRSQLDNEVLEVAVCNKCHRENGLFSRGSLTRQNALTIQFMVEKKFMPPLGFEMTPTEFAQVRKFLHGL